MYNEVREDIEKVLEKAVNISITTWTSLRTHSYVTITAHFIDKSWELKTIVLDTSEMDEKHIAENLTIRLELVKMEWSLEGRISVCVIDNASNQVAADRLCNEWEDLPCFAHTLQLAVHEGLAIHELDKLVKVASKLLGYFKKFPSATTALESTQRRLKVAKKSLGSKL